MSVLELEDLTLHYSTKLGAVKAVDGVSFELEKGRTLAFVGESGCGKTSTAIAILRLLPKNVARYDGKIIFEGANIMELGDEQFRKQVRWRGISMVFQGAMNALNPTARVGKQVMEPVLTHLESESEEAKVRAIESLTHVGLPEDIMKRYPHELSGGMKQRVIIAMALILRPGLVILDEPTSALDVMTQANIMNLLKELKSEEGLSYLFITHDLSLASELADDIAIMYGGQLVEIGPAEEIYKNAQHPYSQGLLKSIPRLRSSEPPVFIPGVPADLVDSPRACRFHPRCFVAFEKCGWTANEVAEALEMALGDPSASVGALAEVEVAGEDILILRSTTDGGDVGALERQVREVLSVKRDTIRAFQGVRDVRIQDGALILEMHEPTVPSPIGEKHWASCLLLGQGEG